MEFKLKPPPMPPDPNKPSTPEEQLARQTEEQERRRIASLLPAVNGALAQITKQKHATGKDWADWWKKNKATFKVED